MNSRLLRYLLAALASFLVLPFLTMRAQTAQPSLAANRVLAPVDESNLVSLEGNTHPLAQPRFDGGPAPVSTPTGRLTLVLQRSASQQQALTEYLADVQNPSSPSFHKWLTPAQYGAAYGISDADLQAVEAWLQSHGFKIENVPAARNLIQFSGTFDQVQNAFHTSIHTYSVNGATHFANATDPQIPAALAPVIAGLSPLNDFHPKPEVRLGPKAHYDATSHTIQPDLTTSGGYLFVDPADAATIYDSPNSALNPAYKGATTYDGTGINIGIAGDSDISLTDVDNYRTAFLGETTPKSPTVVVDGNDAGINGDEIEGLLDNEVAGALAPKANLYFYTSGGSDISSGLYNAILRAINDNTVSILNVSFGGCEQDQGTGGNQFILEMFQQAAAQGISVTVSTGDSGSAGCDNENTETVAQGGFGVNALASTPWTIAVGGTDYDILLNDFSTYVNAGEGSAPYYLSAKKYIPENPWNDSTAINGAYSANTPATSNSATNIVGGGGGTSTIYSKPSFQSSLTSTFNNRDLPDVSFLAGDGTYGATWLLCADNQATGASTSPTQIDCQTTNGSLGDATFTGVGGTSAAAPAFAGMLALVEQKVGSRLGQADYVLYQLAQSKYSTVFHDVTTGNNSVVCASGTKDCGANGFLIGYNAGPNYDLASGLGSVDIAALVNNWSSVSLTSTSTTLDINGSTAAVSAAHGTPLTFSTGVTPAAATGDVAIVANANENASTTPPGALANGQFNIPLTSGSGSESYNGLPGGSYSVYANYPGDTSDAASRSSAINVTIAPETSTTTLAVKAYSATTGDSLGTTTGIPYGSQINLDATIAGTSSDEMANGTEGIATGTVTFLNGSTTLGTATVSGAADSSKGSFLIPSNLASWPPVNSKFTVLPAGTYNATASYSGDASFNKSTSAAAAFTVAKAITTTAAAANPASLASTASSTVTVTITTPYNYGAAGYGASPTGTVTLTGNGNTLATISSFNTTIQSTSPYNVVLTGSTAIPAGKLASGTNTVTATYSGDNNYAGSSGTVTVTVTGGGSGTSPSIALANSGAITVAPGATTGNTATISVTPSGGFTGAVNLSCAVTTAITNPTDAPTCSVTTPVTISGTAAQTATLSVTTTAATSGALDQPLRKFFPTGSVATLALIFFFGIPARRRAWRTLFSVLAIVVVFSISGCGGSSGTRTPSNPGTTAGTYTVTVTGSDAATGKVTASTPVTLNVN